MQMPVIFTFVDTRDLYSISVQTDSDVTCSRSCDERKITKRLKDNQGWEKPVFLKKQLTCFLFLSSDFFCFSLKGTGFCSFCKKNTKPHCELFLLHHAISPFSELHNSYLIYLFWHSNLRVKKCTPPLLSQRVVGQFTPQW